MKAFLILATVLSTCTVSAQKAGQDLMDLRKGLKEESITSNEVAANYLVVLVSHARSPANYAFTNSSKNCAHNTAGLYRPNSPANVFTFSPYPSSPNTCSTAAFNFLGLGFSVLMLI